MRAPHPFGREQEKAVNPSPSLCFVVLCLAVTPVMAADSLPLHSVNKANEIIDAAIEAHGGVENLQALNSLLQDNVFITYATNQSRGTEPPWDQDKQVGTNAIDFEKGFFFGSAEGSGGGFDFAGATIVDQDSGWALDYRAGFAAPITKPDFNNTAGPFIRITPPLVMKQLLERRQYSFWLGTSEVDGKTHDIVTLVMESGPGLSLYLDSETHLLTRMERVLPPFGQVEYRYSDYETIAGIPFNRTFHLLINGEPNIDSTINRIEVNVPVDAYATVPVGLQRIAEQTPDDFNLQEIDEGIFLVGGNGAYGLFVEMDDHLVAIGGTQGAKKRMDEVARHSSKALRYGVLTHHHSDHVPAAADYAAAEATIIALQAHETVVRTAVGTEDAKFEWVQGSMILAGNSRRIELYDIGPTPHSEHLLIAWLPEEKIIFEADHFPLPRNGSIPPAVAPTRAFAAAIDKLGLDYQRIVGAHSSRIGTPADMQAALTAKVVNFKQLTSAY
jgi:glyoxylase-like metal-dependent hydrolase (beta-lactamase superfamily II)